MGRAGYRPTTTVQGLPLYLWVLLVSAVGGLLAAVAVLLVLPNGDPQTGPVAGDRSCLKGEFVIPYRKDGEDFTYRIPMRLCGDELKFHMGVGPYNDIQTMDPEDVVEVFPFGKEGTR